MIPDRNDAAAALRAADTTGRRSRTLFGYGFASPYLLLWGVVWIAGGIAGILAPAHTAIGWAVADGAGLAGTGWLAARQARRSGESIAFMFRIFATASALAAYVVLTLIVLGPVTPSEALAFGALTVAAAYTVAGCWFGLRYAAVGALLAAATVGLHFLAPGWLEPILPFLGGAVLLAGGVWTRPAR